MASWMMWREGQGLGCTHHPLPYSLEPEEADPAQSGRGTPHLTTILGALEGKEVNYFLGVLHSQVRNKVTTHFVEILA